MTKKSLLIILGIILILVQIVNWGGMNKMYVGLYPDNDDLLYPNYTEESDLNIQKVLFAIRAGIDRFSTGFEDYSYGEYDYRVMTSTQIASAMVRESLGCSDGGSFGLFVYDTILTISYSLTGLLGIGLLIASAKADKDQ